MPGASSCCCVASSTDAYIGTRCEPSTMAPLQGLRDDAGVALFESEARVL